MNAAVSSFGGLLNGLLSAIILALAASRGETGEIAAYTVMTAVLSFVSILIGGGASLMYASGTVDERRAIWSQWILIVGPGIIIATIGVSAFYWGRGYAIPALLLSGFVFLLNNYGQLQLADLTRAERFIDSAFVIVGSKVLGLIFALLGLSLTPVLALAAVAQILLSSVMAWRRSSPDSCRLANVSLVEALAAYSMNKHLFGLTAADLYSSKAASVVLSFMVTPQTMGVFGAILNAYQALVAVLYTAIRAPMAARIRARIDGLSRADVRTEGAIVVVAVIMAFVLAWSAPFIATDILKIPGTEAIGWLRVLAASLPFLAINRVIMFTRVGNGQYRSASRVAWLTAITATPTLVIVPILGGGGAALVSLIAEAVTAIVVLAEWCVHRRSRVRSSARPHSS
jgi:hypothetical protein